MMDLRSKRDALRIIDRTTAVGCDKDVRSWRSFRSLVGLMVPCCGCQSISTAMDDSEANNLGSAVTGTLFGYRKGRVSFCVQEDPRSPPFLLLEFAMPTYLLAKEMQNGVLRIALECEKNKSNDGSLFSVPIWAMYCNGRKVGFTVKRNVNDSNYGSISKVMQSISVGAGVVPTETKGDEGELMYMRATYKRVTGSSDSESFHMINPDGSVGQELSIFFLRS